MEHPPKQGLKPQIISVHVRIEVISFNGTSTKTRIETSLERQGLKPRLKEFRNSTRPSFNGTSTKTRIETSLPHLVRISADGFNGTSTKTRIET